MNLDAQEAALGLIGLSPTNLTTTTTAVIHSPPTSTIPTKRKQRDETETAGEAIDCICGFEVDDGFSIACDVCSRWCHSACFDVAPEEIPDEFKCWTCKPRLASFKERAVRMQKERLEMGGVAIVEKQRRKASPGLERKHRRISVDKRKRRPSMANEDEHVDNDEPWSQSYVHISQDIISDDETRARLRRQAQHWRGVTAVADSPPLVKELPPAALASYSNPHILPPAYSLHTAAPISSNHLITDYKSSITPSSSYLSDPLNAYAHLGMPKPFVHLFGPPLDVALDSRLVGNQGRFARSGCRPNAVLRPLLCDDSDSLGFGVFALRDLKADEEVVLGWEWDDGNVVHNLPALLKTPHLPPFHACRPRQVQYLRHQMSNILHALTSTFTTCACGGRAQDCAIDRMAAFVDGLPTQSDQQEQEVGLGPLVGRKRGFRTRERIPFSGGMAGMVMCRDNETSPHQPLPAFTLSPSSPIPNERSVKGKERAIDDDGDIEMTDARDRFAGRVCETKSGQATKPIAHESLQTSLDSPNQLKSHSRFDLRPPDPGGPYRRVSCDQPQPDNEDSMPPKMRKRWMHRELESLRELNGDTSPSSSQGSNHNHIIRHSESPGSSSTSGVSLESPVMAPSKLTKGPGLSIEYGHDRSQFENEHHEQHCRCHHHREDDLLTNSHQHQPVSMPPPPMPAFLDPTTISSMKSNANQHFEFPLSTLIPPSISPLTSFAHLSLLSPALLRLTPPPSLSAPLVHPRNSGMTTTIPTLSPPRDENAAAWSPLRRHAAPLPSTSPPLPAPVSPLSHHKDIASSSSSPPPLTIIPANDMDDQAVESPSCTPSPPPSPSSLQPETLLMHTNDEIQSTPHSPDPMWRADSPSGDHVNPSIGSDTPIHILNHDGPPESPLEVPVKGLEETSKNDYGHWESPVLDVSGADHTDLRISSSRSPSPPSPALQVLPGDTTIAVVDSCGEDEEEDTTTDPPDNMNVGQSNHDSSTGLESAPLNDLPSFEPSSISLPLSQPLVSDSLSVSTHQHNSTAEYQPVVKEEESRSKEEGSRLEASPLPPAPKVKMSLRDFALRKKRQRAEEEMTKSFQDTPSSGGMNLPYIGGEGGGSLNGKQVNREGQADGQSSNGRTVVDGVGLKGVELGKDSVDGLRRDISYQGASSLSRPMVKHEVVDVPETSSIKPATTNGYHHPQPSPSSPLTPTSGALAARTQATATSFTNTTHGTKQELIEHPIPTTAVIQPTILDSARYAAMYNNSRSISPINPDPHHFESYSPPRLCQEDGEIAEIMEIPPLLPSSSLASSLPTAPPAMNRLATTVPSSGPITPIPEGPTKRADFAFLRSVSSSSQVRHSPPTHPRSFNASPPYRQQPPSVPTPPPAARGTGVTPPTAPRALRQSMLSNRPTPTTPTAMTSSSSTVCSTSTATPASSTAITTSTGTRFPPYIPRGPSADRDRGWDMDQTQYVRSLLKRDSREGGHAWGR